MSVSKFDKKVEQLSKSIEVPNGLVDAIVYVNDTLETAKIIAFEISDTPTLCEIIQIYDRIVDINKLTKKDIVHEFCK